MYNPVSNEKREQNAAGRFELICERYINGNERDRQIILSFLNDDEKQQFLIGCGLYHMFTDQRYFDIIKQAVGERIYKDCHVNGMIGTEEIRR